MRIVVVVVVVDIDECAMGADICDPNANCTNTIGSYNCTCNPGYSGNGFLCSSKLVVIIMY